MNYSTNIYQGFEFSIENPDEFNEIQELVPKLSQQQIVDLQRLVSKKEVKGVVFQMDGLKAPGPDGIPASFFQKF